MIIHCVFLHLDHPDREKDCLSVMAALGALKSEVDGMVNFASGPNRDFEHKTPDHTFGFVITFQDRAAHLAYERHPRHVELGGQLVAMCRGGADGILVYDIEA